MPSSEEQEVRRSRRSRRRKTDPVKKLARWLAIGGGVLILLAIGSVVWWVWAGGLRGPRFMERWPEAGDEFAAWQTLEPGIEYSRSHLRSPRTLRCHALRIDLQDPTLELVTPRAHYAGWAENQVQWPMTWLRENQLRAVLNATPFTPAPIFPGRPTRLQGLAVSEGEQWSDPVPNLDSLVVAKDGSIRFVPAGKPLMDPRWGAGGFLIIRRNGENVGDTSAVDAVTAVGLSADRRWLYWMVVDGGQPGYSEGVTPREASDLIGKLGASEAIRMDGGSSSALGVAGMGILNRPRNPLYDGAQRPVGNVLGIRRKDEVATPR